MKTIIKLVCNDQRLKSKYTPVIASGGINETDIDISFSEEWEGFSCVGCFYVDDDHIYYANVVDGICPVPSKVVSVPGSFLVSFYGVKDAVKKTSTEVKITVKQGARMPISVATICGEIICDKTTIIMVEEV